MLACYCEHVLVVDVQLILVRRADEVMKSFADQALSVCVQQHRGGQIRFEDHAGLVQRQIADRGKVVQIDVTVSGRFEFELDSPELLILHLQLDLVHLKLVYQLSKICGR